MQVLGMEFSVVEILADLRRVFLAYLEAPNSILVKNQKIIDFYEIPPIPPISPHWANGCLGSLAAVI